MTSTERKLDEARYFLSQLNTDDPYFDYVLSAFLNAARSTAWVMRYEFGKVEGWELWFDKTDVFDEETKLLKEINDLRIKSSKQEGIKTDFYFLDEVLIEEKYYPVIKELLSKNGEYLVEIKSVEESQKEPSEKDEGTLKFNFTKNSSREKSTLREDIYKVCKLYFNFLEAKVGTCVKKFGSENSDAL